MLCTVAYCVVVLIFCNFYNYYIFSYSVAWHYALNQLNRINNVIIFTYKYTVKNAIYLFIYLPDYFF